MGYDDDGSTYCCTSFFALIFSVAIPTSMIIVGSYHIDDCPMEPMIPIFMVVSGVAWIFHTIFTFCFNIWGRWERQKLTKCSMALAILLYVFLFAWNLAGAYWVFKEWDSWDDLDEEKQAIGCHRDTYLFIFSLSIIYWILFPFSCLGFFKKAKDVYEEV
ncbi:transmembrane protein 272-like [Clytia hemisphaerica]|uniref:Uncharacterized protein n=1 Tax=Clytia hemisphaerica TaxID=252671 RepID=A0A7M5VCF6_9CNID